jgi:hypothetical protein
MAFGTSTLNFGCFAIAAFTAACTDAVNLFKEIDTACAILRTPFWLETGAARPHFAPEYHLASGSSQLIYALRLSLTQGSIHLNALIEHHFFALPPGLGPKQIFEGRKIAPNWSRYPLASSLARSFAAGAACVRVGTSNVQVE